MSAGPNGWKHVRCARENETTPVRQELPGPVLFFLRQHRTIRQEVSGRIFVPIQSLENEGILYVFLVFQTEEVGQKGGWDSQAQLCGVALNYKPEYVPNTLCKSGIYATFSDKKFSPFGRPVLYSDRSQSESCLWLYRLNSFWKWYTASSGMLRHCAFSVPFARDPSASYLLRSE